jgi:hypothetical protein
MKKIILLLLIPIASFASIDQEKDLQDQEEYERHNPKVPIDDGIFILFALAGVYGIYALRKDKENG